MSISVDYEKIGQAAACGIQSALEKVIQEKVQEEEYKIFRAKVLDGTLETFKGAHYNLDLRKEVLFCSQKTRAKLLESSNVMADANFIVSSVIKDGEVYLLTDEQLKKQFLEGKNTKKLVHKNYTATQASNNHVTIFKDGKRVLHSQYNKELTEDAFIKMIELYETLTESGTFDAIYNEDEESEV